MVAGGTWIEHVTPTMSTMRAAATSFEIMVDHNSCANKLYRMSGRAQCIAIESLARAPEQRGPKMHRYVGSCSPGQVHMLQSICDMVLLELQARGGVNSTALLRDVIARRVMSQFYDETFKIGTAAEAVLLSFSAGGGEGMVSPASKEVERALVP